MRRRGLAIAAGAALAALSAIACVQMRRPVVPIPSLGFDAGPSDARTLIVFLPGLYDEPRDFARHGFVDAVRQARPDAALVAVDAHFGYYRERSVVDRLWDDVLAPARQRGVDEIWLVGVSLGGFGSFLVADEHPEAITGAVAIAPYLGPRKLLREIRAAGGPRAWRPSDPEDTFQRLWLSWRDVGGEPRGPILYLGYGRDDRGAGAHAFLADLLPAEQVASVAGGHEWKPWLGSFEILLERGALSPR